MLVVNGMEEKTNQFKARSLSGYDFPAMPQAPDLSGFFIGGFNERN